MQNNKLIKMAEVTGKGGKGPATEPLLTFVILLANGKTITQTATSWHETTGDEGEGIAYHFYVHKTRVMTIEYTEVRAVFCSEYCDVQKVVSAMRGRNGTRK